MHDVLEGYLPYIFKQLLFYVRQFGVMLNLVNSCIEAFDFGQDQKPSPVPESTLKSTEGTCIGQSGKFAIILFIFVITYVLFVLFH